MIHKIEFDAAYRYLNICGVPRLFTLVRVLEY
jgi:hypothetical protein